MRLSKHEKQIVDAIILGTVYDIPSYLMTFGKCQTKKYDLASLEVQFKATDGSRQYKVITDEDKFYIKGAHQMDGPFGLSHIVETKLPRKLEDIPDDSWEYRDAMYINDLKPVEIEYSGKTFSFDFAKDGVYVADNFEDIVNFMTLWVYLRQESLIVDVSQEVKAEDLGVLFELIPKEQREKASYTVLGEKIPDSSVHSIIKTIDLGDFWPSTPHFLISKYCDSIWKINEEHLKNCEEFIGRKILSTERLRLFAKRNYTAVEEWHYRIPLLISLVVLVATIFPIAQSILIKDESDYLLEISHQLASIEEQIESKNMSDDVLSELSAISQELSGIAEGIKSYDHSDAIANLASQIEELNRLLSEPTNAPIE